MIAPISCPVSRRGEKPAAGSLRVSIDWSKASSGEPCLASSRVEVEVSAPQNANLDPPWTCREPSGSRWEDVLGAAGCTEVVLTAELGDEPDAKHLVFGLAERVTQLLSATHASVRVRFLQRSIRARRTEPSTKSQ